MSTARPRVLIVENYAQITAYLQTLVAKRGFDVFVAEGFGSALSEQAVALAQRVRPHIAIVDLRLEDDHSDDRSGLALLQALKSARCILYSAYLASDLLRIAARQPNVDWVDKQNYELLYIALDEAARKSSAQQRGVTIHWPNSWQREQIIQALFSDAPTLPQVEILDDIIAQLFPNNQRIVPEAINGSVNGLQSVMRGRSIVAKVYPDALQPMIVKLGNAGRACREYANYQLHVHNQLPGRFHTQIENHLAFWDLGGTVYSFMGAGQKVLPTFSQHYAKALPAEAILSPLRHLFQTVWQAHYERARPIEAPSLFAVYDEIFHLSQRWERIDPTLLAMLQDNLGLSILDPVAWTRSYGRDSTIPSARQAVTHGDLHGDNLFVEGDRAWIIDFERTGPSHALRDFAELEVDIFVRLLAPDAIDWPSLYRLARLLIEPTVAGQGFGVDAGLEEQTALGKARQVIGGIRSLAREVVLYSDQREYLWAMLFDALFVASVDSMPPSQRMRALLYASLICQRLSHWGDEWRLD